MICNKCGKNVEGTDRCPQCGNLLSEENNKTYYCWKCGKALPSYFEHCIYCGSEVIKLDGETNHPQDGKIKTKSFIDILREERESAAQNENTQQSYSEHCISCGSEVIRPNDEDAQEEKASFDWSDCAKQNIDDEQSNIAEHSDYDDIYLEWYQLQADLGNKAAQQIIDEAQRNKQSEAIGSKTDGCHPSDGVKSYYMPELMPVEEPNNSIKVSSNTAEIDLLKARLVELMEIGSKSTATSINNNEDSVVSQIHPTPQTEAILDESLAPAEEVTTDAMSWEELERDLFGEIEEKRAEDDECRKIDPFYTLYKKNEEFQKLLDEEYNKLKADSEEAPTGSSAIESLDVVVKRVTHPMNVILEKINKEEGILKKISKKITQTLSEARDQDNEPLFFAEYEEIEKNSNDEIIQFADYEEVK